MIKSGKKLLAPVLDRLLSSPFNSTAPMQSYQLVRQLRESVRRDIERLLNTRKRCVSTPSQCEYLESSLLNYGLPDWSFISLESEVHRKKFCREVERTILQYEPRISSVRVQSDAGVDPEDVAIRFRIEAQLHANPVSETIVFDSALNPVTQTIAVSEVM